jgi:hypothetical protein
MNNAHLMRRHLNLLEARLREQVDEAGIRETLARNFLIQEGIEVTVRPDGKVDVPSSVVLRGKHDRLPLQFGKVSGNFVCHRAGLKSLEGAPESVNADFDCSRNELTSLIGGPRDAQNYYCQTNKLTNLVGGPESVGDNLFCQDNPLKTLEGVATDAVVHLTWHVDLPLLRLLSTAGFFIFPSAENMYIDAMSQGWKIEEILNKYHEAAGPLRQRMIACQKELIDAGFASNAKF